MRNLTCYVLSLAVVGACADSEEPQVVSNEQSLTQPEATQPAGTQDVPVPGSEAVDPNLVNRIPPPAITPSQDVISAQKRYLAEVAALRTRLAAQGVSELEIEAQSAALKRTILGD